VKYKKNTRFPSYSESIGAAGSYVDTFDDSEAIRGARIQIVTIGANCTIKTQESGDGVTWADLDSNTTTGFKAKVSPYARYVRTRVDNAGGGAESCVWNYINEYDHYDITRG
jgi:hypothetical protein